MKIPLRDLPLFPLQTVLFPRMNLPLHIFEPRYREMISRCVKEDIAFGVLLIRSGREVGGDAEPQLVGTAAQILHVDHLPDGRMNINTVGVERFRLLEHARRELYLTGNIELWQDGLGPKQVIARRFPRLEVLFRTYSDAVMRLVGSDPTDADAFRTDDPAFLSYVIAATLQGDTLEKQRLLEAPTVAHRMDTEIRLIQREIEILRRELDARARLKREAAAFYQN